MTQIQPILLSAIICSRVIFDKVSGQPSIIDIMQTINAANYPARHAQLVFFCEMTNGHGITDITIRLVHDQEKEKVIFEQQGHLKFADVKQIVTLVMNLRGIVFPQPGEYRFQLFTGDSLVGERRIMCRKVELKKKGQ